MEFRVLGPIEVWGEGAEVSLGGRKLRALLALLLLHPNEVVPADRLIDELWGEDSPEDAAAALRVNVSRLRKALPEDAADDQIARLRHPGRARHARSRPLRAAGGRGAGTARSRSGRRRVGAATRGAVAVAGPGARGVRLRELRPGGDRPARGDQAGSTRAPDRRRPRTRAPRRAGRRARGTRRRTPAPRAPAEVSDDGAVPVGSAGGRPGRLPGCAPSTRRRARDRTEPGAPASWNGPSSATTPPSTSRRSRRSRTRTCPARQAPSSVGSGSSPKCSRESREAHVS